MARYTYLLDSTGSIVDLTFKRNCGYNKHLSHFVREDVPLTYTPAKESQNLLQSKPNVDQDMEEEEDD